MADYAQQGTATLACAVCGAQVLPGQAFCDNCGADLRANPPIGSDSPAAPAASAGEDTQETMIATPPQQPSPDNEETMIAPPSMTPTPPEAPAAPEQTATPDTEETMIAPPESQPQPTPATEETVIAPPESQPQPTPATEETVIGEPAESPTPVPPAPPAVSVPPVPPVESTPPAAPTVPASFAPDAETALAEVDNTDAERQRLEEEIEKHEKTIAQMEQISSLSGGVTPDYLVSAMQAARDALAKAQKELAALPSGPDPAEVARLESERDQHKGSVTQLEQMAQSMPAGTLPDYLQNALDTARAELNRVENELQTLLGGPAAPAASAVPPAPAAPPAPVAPPPAPTVAGNTTPAPQPDTQPVPEPASAPPAAPAPAVPRLVVGQNGDEIPFPQGKTEIIIGREDPVSHIFPEIDLTPYGGETGGVSRQHARINLDNGQWQITDLNSTNFTHVDGARLDPNVATPISDGAEIRFGRVATTFRT
jgi:hypothetical protein